MLKPIPQEIPPNGHSSQSHSTAKIRHLSPKKKTAFLNKLQQKMEAEQKVDHKIIKVTFVKLLKYVKKSENDDVGEMGDLIHSLQRSALSLERKRAKLLREQTKKKRK